MTPPRKSHTSQQLPVLLILGPTAGGKTRLAIDIAKSLSGGAGEIISADSMQVYRGMDIGTAKPPAQEREGIPHHLIDLVEPDDDSFSVDRWLELADQAIRDIRLRGNTPIIVGGTNLYVRAFLEGLMEGPEPDPELRAQLNQLELAELRAQLEQCDPASAQRIHPNDRKRTVRALEVFHQTGKPLSELQTQWSAGPLAPVRKDTIIIGLDYPVDVINRRINARVAAMMAAGFLQEVRQLHSAGRLGRNAREALGYKQLIDHLESRCSLEEAVEQIKIRTRRYAKQQRTWLRRFRHQPGVPSFWLPAAELSAQELAGQALAHLARITRERPVSPSVSE